jgi:hypothetical protein
MWNRKAKPSQRLGFVPNVLIFEIRRNRASVSNRQRRARTEFRGAVADRLYVDNYRYPQTEDETPELERLGWEVRQPAKTAVIRR